MRMLWMWCLCAVFLGTARGAQAQVRESDVRLYLDLGIVSWTSNRVRAETPAGDDSLETRNVLGAGPAAGGVGGVGIGYAATAHLIPSLYFSLQHVKRTERTEVDDDEISEADFTERQFELRPFLEVPFNPRSRFVLHAIAGLTFLRRVTDPGDESAFGLGPVLGLGGHGFISQAASLDLGLVFRGAFVKNEDVEDRLEALGFDDVKQRQLAILFTLGASFWL